MTVIWFGLIFSFDEVILIKLCMIHNSTAAVSYAKIVEIEL